MTSRSRLDVQLDSAGALIQRLAQKMGDVRDHVAEQKNRVSPWPTGSDAPSVTASSESSGPERYVLVRETFDRYLADIEAAERAVIAIAADMFESVNKLVRMRAPGPEPCNRRINATCENAASEHRDPITGTTYTGTCDACWLAACPGCHDREPTPSRRITIGGRLVPSCEPCYRRELRRTGQTINAEDVIEDEAS